MNGIGYGITPFMGSHGILARSSGGGVTPFVNEYSMSFDGVDEYFSAGNPASLQITGSLTISVWVKMSLTADDQTPILSKDNTTQRCFALWGCIFGVNNPRFIIFNNNTAIRVNATTNIKDNNWHHILVSFIPSTSLSIYVDGVLEGINTTSIPSSIDNDAINFEIGRLSTFYWFEGNIDEVAIWNNDQSSNASSIYNGGVPTDLTSLSPVSWWRMGDNDTWNGSTWTLTDNGSGGNDATSVNMEEGDRLPISPSSFSLNSFSFDGVDEYLNCGSTLYLQNLTDFSVSLWAKQTTATTEKCLITDWIWNNNGNFAIQTANVLGSATKLTFAIRVLGGIPRIITTINYPFIENVWNHIVVTFSSGNANIYVNGISESFTGATLPTSLAYGNGFLNIGRFNGLVRYFNGNIDEVAVFNSELSASDVATIFNNGIPNDISSLSPISWWRMGEEATWSGSAWTLTDQGSGGNNATSVNMEEADKTGDQPYVI